MKKTSRVFLVLSAVSLVLCLILAPVVCMPVDPDEIMGTFEVSVFEPLITAFILAIASAVFANLYIRKIAEEKKKVVNPLMMSIGVGLFGLFYGLRTAYSDAAKVLTDFVFSWGGSGIGMTELMPEWADKFRRTAGMHTVFMILSLGIAGFGFFKIYTDLRKDK